MSFLKRLFGGGAPQAAPAPSNPIEAARAALSATDRRREPALWRQRQEQLAVALGNSADAQPRAEATASLSEAAAHFGASAAAEPNTGRAGQLHSLRGHVLHKRANLLEGDEKGEVLADAANAYGAAIAALVPEVEFQPWFDAQFYRGAILEELARLKGGETGLAWFDESLACFDAVDSYWRRVKGVTHPVAAYNRAVVLQARAKLSPPSEARASLEAARMALHAAKADPQFGPQLSDFEARLSSIEDELKDLR